MSSPKKSGPEAVGAFLIRLALIYGLLILPWPGLKEATSFYFQSLGNLVFFSPEGQRHVKFEPLPPRSIRAPETKIMVANRALRDASGHTPARQLDIDLRGVAWVPVVLLAALILATPVPAPRRAWALLWGMIGIHLYIGFSCWVYILNQSDVASGLNLVAFNPWQKWVMNMLENILITQMGPSFVVPVLMWILVLFRREDLETWAISFGTKP